MGRVKTTPEGTIFSRRNFPGRRGIDVSPPSQVKHSRYSERQSFRVHERRDPFVQKV